jgi:hypothetical protein
MKNAIGGRSDQICERCERRGAAAQEPAKRGLRHARGSVSSMAANASRP